MTDPILEAIAEGEQRALHEWQLEYPEPCDDCEWREEQLKAYHGVVRVVRHLDPCPKHGGTR